MKSSSRFLTLAVVAIFSAVSLNLAFSPQASALTVAESTAQCKKRVTKINNRGKKMAKKSAELQAKYKKADAGWKKKISDNKKYATKYSTDDRLEAKVAVLRKQTEEFRLGVKEYNNLKRAYIQERNAQVKSYKHYKNDCSSRALRSKSGDKMREWREVDGKKLVSQTKAISDVYKSKVRQNILDMREARAGIIAAKKGIKGIETAEQSDIDSNENSLGYQDIGDDADELFDGTEFDPTSNQEDPTV